MSVRADDDSLRYTGRWNFDDPKQPWVGWSGSTVSVRFRGSEISAGVAFDGDGERLRIVVDGIPEEPARFIPAGRQTVLLASGLDAESEHTVVLMKEAYSTSTLTFFDFEVTGSELLEMPPSPKMRIAFFGDSNMEGYSLYNEKNDGDNGTWFAYPATVSRMLGAEMHLQALGSATLDGPTANDVVSFVHSEKFGAESSGYRDSFEPHVIVVNAGANDIFRVEANERERFVKQNYRNVVAALRDVYGDEPHIILSNAFGWAVDEPANYSHEIVDEIGGNLSVHLFPWCWEQWHGDMVDHAGQAQHLASYIESLNLGFAVRQAAEVVSGYSGTFDVSNGGFEGAARDNYGAFGWRYFEDGVERVRDPDGAPEGEHYIRLKAGKRVHQCVDATGDLLPGATQDNRKYVVTASIRSTGGTGAAMIGADYEQQAMYKRENPEVHSFAVTDEWREYSAMLTAPEGTWKTFVVLESESGEVEFDDVRMTAANPMLRRSFEHDGVEREYFLYVPKNASDDMPVVVAIHGYTSTATGFQFAHDLNFHADRHGYMVVYAQGSHFLADDGQGGSYRVTTWNAFGDAKPEANAGPQCAADASEYPCPPECSECGRCGWASCYDDIGYFEKLIDRVDAEFEVDSQRIYALGVSAGGMMMHRLGCELSERFAAIAPIIAQPPPGYACGPDTDLPLMLLYGAKDETIRYDGLAGKDDGFIYTSVADTAEAWAEALHCESGPHVWENEYSAAADLVCTAYSSCRVDGQEVVNCMDPDGDHRWPEQRPDRSTATCITAEQYESMPGQEHCEPRGEDGIHLGMDLVWDFFSRYASDDVERPAN